MNNAVKKAFPALPNSPRKWTKVIKQFMLQVNVDSPMGSIREGRPEMDSKLIKNSMKKTAFYERDDIRNNEKKEIYQKRHLYVTINDLYKLFKKEFPDHQNFMAPFYGWGSTTSRLQSHYKEPVYFLPLISQKFLLLI